MKWCCSLKSNCYIEHITSYVLFPVIPAEPPEVQLIANMSILSANEHTNLTCSASKGYPLFHNITLVKNDQVVLNRIANEIVLSTSMQPVEKFGVYKCLVNNSVHVTEVAVTVLKRGKVLCY